MAQDGPAETSRAARPATTVRALPFALGWPRDDVACWLRAVPLDDARQEQRSLMVTDERDERVSPSSAAAAPPPNAGAVASGGGGVGTLYWRMSAAQLHRLKTAASAQTRHDALWAEVIRLLRGAGHAVRTAPISRDGRRRSPTMSPYHFGNATCISFSPPCRRRRLATGGPEDRSRGVLS